MSYQDELFECLVKLKVINNMRTLGDELLWLNIIILYNIGENKTEVVTEKVWMIFLLPFIAGKNK